MLCPGDPTAGDHHLEYYTMLLCLEKLLGPSLLQLCTRSNDISGLSVPHTSTVSSQTKMALTGGQ